jgi:hypothetical protein
MNSGRKAFRGRGEPEKEYGNQEGWKKHRAGMVCFYGSELDRAVFSSVPEFQIKF